MWGELRPEWWLETRKRTVLCAELRRLKSFKQGVERILFAFKKDLSKAQRRMIWKGLGIE